jgi:uncharacterized membrane protein YcaP (DUF421 family)
MIEHMFHLQLPVLEKVLRSVLVYLFLVISFRLAGKRELAQMTTFDLVVILTISNVLQNAAIGDDNTVLGGVIGATSMLVVNYLLVRFLFRHPRVEQLLEGEPEVLIRDGRVVPEVLARELITEPELLAAIRRQGVAEIADVALAMLETNGTISVVPKRPTPEEAFEQRVETAMARLEAAVSRLERQVQGMRWEMGDG